MTEELRILVKAETQKAVNDLKNLERQSGKTESGAQGLMAGFSKLAIPIAAAGAAMAGLVAVGREAVGIFRENEQAAARLSAILKATGGAAGISAQELSGWRQELYESTLLTTQQIDTMSGLLLTFRNIGEDTFPRAQRAVADMAEVFGSLDSSAMQLGRALQDPVTGISALRRVGITFSEEQENQIRNFTELNDLASAQAVILAEVENQVGGTAQAMTELSTAGFDRMGRAIDDLKSSFGAFISENFGPTVNELAIGLERAVASVDRAALGRTVRERGTATTADEARAAIEAIDREMPLIEAGSQRSGYTQGLDRVRAERRRWVERMRNLAMEEEAIARRTAQEEAERARQARLLAEYKAFTRQADSDTLKSLMMQNEVVEDIVDDSKEFGRIASEESESNQRKIEQLERIMELRTQEIIAAEQAAQAESNWAQNLLEMFDEFEEQWGSTISAAQGFYSAWNDLERNRHENMMANLKAELKETMDMFDSQIWAAEQAGQDTTNLEQQRLNKRLEMEEQIARKEEEYRRNAFEQRKAEAIATATMQSALAIINTLATVPGPLGIAAAAGIGALTAGQIALIAGQQYPALAEGGITTGPTMAMIGEGGEPEMVLPLSKAKSMGFGGGVTIVINGDVIGVPRDEFIRDLDRRLSSLQRIGVA